MIRFAELKTREKRNKRVKMLNLFMTSPPGNHRYTDDKNSILMQIDIMSY